MYCFVLINEASTSPLFGQVTAAWLARVGQAITLQCQRDVAACWQHAEGTVVRAGSGPSDIAVGEVAFAIVDQLPNAPGAIAYHDVAGNAVPVAFLALSTCSTLDDVSTAISHEVVETVGDEECNLWADDSAGSSFARELCDAVESNTYDVDLGDGQPSVRVSDFVLRAFFAPNAPAPFSFMQATAMAGAFPAGPFQTAGGGYQIKRTAGTGETQVTGTVARRLAARRHWSSRTYRRGARL